MTVQTSRATQRGPALTLALILGMGLASSGCGSDDLGKNAYLTGPSASTTSTLASLSVTPSKPTISVGGTVQLTGTARATGGVVVPGAVFTWTSIHPELATVDSTGLVRGIAVGSTSIRASSGGLSVSATVTVTAGTAPAPGQPATVTVSPGTVSSLEGTTVQLVATVKDSSGNVLTGQKVAWASSAPATAAVDSTGVVRAVAPGSAVVSASVAGKQDQAAVTVTSGGSVAQGNVVVNLSSRQQAMTGWEATAQAGQGTPSFPIYSDALFTKLVDLGITRLRLAVRSGAENPVDYWTQMKQGLITEATFSCLSYTVVNDDADPQHINAAGFHFSELDSTVEQVVLPVRAKLSAAGRKLYLNLNYTAFTGSCGAVATTHQNPQEYAEFALATFQHLQQKYGLVPDSWEMILEPDNGTPLNSGQLIGQALAATAARLAAAGFHPAFVAPSTKVASNAPTWFDQIQAVPGAAGLVSEISYHRYGSAPTLATLDAIGQRTRTNGVRSSMLEKIGAGYNELIDDLLHARVSSWQEYTVAFTGTDNGGKYFVVDATNPASPILTMGNRARYLRQFFHYVGAGATRVDASTTQGGLTPVAFQDAAGKAVLVVRATAAATIKAQGLPAGTYGVRYTTAGATDAAPCGDQVVSAGQLVTATIPAAGLITIFER